MPELLASIEDPQACFVGGGAAIYESLIVSRPGWRILRSDLFLGRAVSQIAFRQAERKSFTSAAALQAYYLRRPDAELKWKQQ